MSLHLKFLRRLPARFLLRRVVGSLCLILILIVINFLLIHLAPGDPAHILAGQSGDEKYYEFIRAKFGLDQPLGTQLWIYLTSVLRGDFGYSLGYQQPVINVIAARVPATLLLMLSAVSLSSVAGVVLGVEAARRENSFSDRAINTCALVGHSVPSFSIGHLLLIASALHLGLFPVQNMMSQELTNARGPEGFDLWRSFRQSRTALAGGVLLALFLFVTICAEQIAPRDPQQTSDETFRPPSAQFLFGTDDLGRDVLSGVVHGARTSISIGVIVAVLSGCVGALVGLAAGYAGGRLDDLLMRVTELFLIPPRFFLALVAAALFGANFFTLVAVLSVTYWPLTARLVRAEVLSLKERSFIEAAHAMGASPARILFHDILPNALPLIITNVTLMIGGVILVEAGLSFVGLGDANQISWGYMLHNGQHFIRDAWWIIFFPTLAISLLVLALNAVGDALNSALDPKSRIEHLN